jgi:2-methylisocitrate lyase-like PEP mutase family enzyme
VGGTPAECVDTLSRYADAGADRVYLQTLDVDDLDHIELVAAEVAPQLS